MLMIMKGAPRLELYFLGTVAGTPSRERNVSSTALRLTNERGSFWLFDCGEGTQHQILSSPLKLGRLEFIFITHLHGDHIYGLPGLLTSRSNQGAKSPLTVYGPRGIRQFLETALSMSGARLDYKLQIEEIQPGIVFEDRLFKVETDLLEHRIDSYGYRITEKPKPGRLYFEKLKSLGVPPGPAYAKLKSGHDVKLNSETTLMARDFVGEAIPGRIVTILGDTRICESGKGLANDVDTLVHEATFAHSLRELAYRYYHSTAHEAATLAKECHVGHLILTHFSSRYQGEQVNALVKEARSIHKNTDAAQDFAFFPIVKKP